MKITKYPYWVYVFNVFLAWIIVFLAAWNLISLSRFEGVFIFGCGFMLGVLGASLARLFFK